MPLSPTLLARLAVLSDRHEEVAARLAEPETVADREQFAALSREFAELEPVIVAVRENARIETELAEAAALARDPDPELRALADDETARLQVIRAEAEQRLLTLLLPRDPDDTANIFLEIRAGTRGDEAAIFAGDLFRMYSRYAESRG